MRVVHDDGPGRVSVAITERVDGDFGIASAGVDRRRQAVVDRSWTWMHQVHGNRCLASAEPGDGAGRDADAAWSRHPDAVLCVQVADCVPIALLGDDDSIGVIHAGWRGLVDGVVEATSEAMGRGGSTPKRAVIGPHIRAHCYEFGNDDLASAAARLGDHVVSFTGSGRPAFDLTSGVLARLEDLGIEVVAHDRRCTCSPELFSHRVRRDAERMALVVYRA